jgi:hypothetical protein
MKLNNIGSLITVGDGDRGHCLGYLFAFDGHGIYSPDGKVEVSKEDADTHNRLLSEAEIAGLDNHCEAGQYGALYIGVIDGRTAIKTFIGTCVTTDVTIKGQTVTFRRHGKVYRGRKSNEHDLLNFRRIS